jgi:hypothetical protein
VERRDVYVSIRQHTSAYISIRDAVGGGGDGVRAVERRDVYVYVRSAYVSICQHMSAYVSIRHYTSAYVSQSAAEEVD